MEMLGFRERVQKLAFKGQRRKPKTRANLQGRKKLLLYCFKTVTISEKSY